MAVAVLRDLADFGDPEFWEQTLGFLPKQGRSPLEILTIHGSTVPPMLVSMAELRVLATEYERELTAPESARFRAILNELERYGIDRDEVKRRSKVPVYLIGYIRRVSLRHKQTYASVKKLIRIHKSLAAGLDRAHVDPALTEPVISELRRVAAVLESAWPNGAALRAWRRRCGINTDVPPDTRLRVWTDTGKRLLAYIKPRLTATEASDTPAYRYVFNVLTARYPRHFTVGSAETFRRRIS